MKKDLFIQNLIAKNLLEENKREREGHTPSGKLSATMLALPLQWQILKVIGVPERELDEYTLRKFIRGHEVEAWLVGHLKPLKTQIKVNFEGVVGIVDALVDTKDWDFKLGEIPVEIKSVTNMKFKRLTRQDNADYSHLLQGCFYALALDKEQFSICYVASDDYRIATFVYERREYSNYVFKAIKDFNEQLAKKVVPVFESVEDWQKLPKYSKYPDWQNLSQEEVMNKLKTEYPESYNKLMKKT